tara:strand:+ start:1297 stop:1953 length:657 start_codon:yes stop_codon:yes gene_type:complete
MTESQDHGFIVEDITIRSHTGRSKKEYEKLIDGGYTSEFDIVKDVGGASFNASIKVSKDGKNIGCGDILRMYNATKYYEFTMIVWPFEQIGKEKKFDEVYEFYIDPSYHKIFWEGLGEEKLKDFDNYIKNIPNGYEGQQFHIQLWKDRRQELYENLGRGLMSIDAKVDSKKQRRTQCGFKIKEIKNVGIPYKVYMNNYRKISLPLILESSPRKRNGSL